MRFGGQSAAVSQEGCHPYLAPDPSEDAGRGHVAVETLVVVPDGRLEDGQPSRGQDEVVHGGDGG